MRVTEYVTRVDEICINQIVGENYDAGYLISWVGIGNQVLFLVHDRCLEQFVSDDIIVAGRKFGPEWGHRWVKINDDGSISVGGGGVLLERARAIVVDSSNKDKVIQELERAVALPSTVVCESKSPTVKLEISVL